MKNIVSIRKELNVRTVFNYLGPFANPASVERQIIGVASVEIAKKLAVVGKSLGYKHLLIVTSEDGLDEVSISSKTLLFEIKDNAIEESIIDPVNHGFQKVPTNELLGDGAKLNAGYIREILQGKKNSKRNIVVFNSAFALYVSGVVKEIKEGITLAEKSIDSGRAKSVLENVIKETQKYA